jgi:2-polyprenyl-3-methyl-5-hydroxy-6-metoxy-1,4-benzoquinol methylase
VTEERLDVLLQRLEREREDADRTYNAALTALDQSLQPPPELPDPPPEYDELQVTPINTGWDILPAGAPAVDGSWRGRLRSFIWNLVGPPLEQQRQFNAALVDHLNRNTVGHRESARAVATLVGAVRQHLAGIVAFQNRLILYLQTITLYADTKDRAVAGQAQVLNAAISAMTDDWLKRWESLAAREQRFNSRALALDDLRASVTLAQQTSLTLKREVERVLAGTTGTVGTTESGGTTGIVRTTSGGGATPDLDAYKYLSFEDQFRGSPTEIRARLAKYVPRFIGQTDVLDIGCGRGEFLDLLRSQGIRGRGLDLNHEMVEVSRVRGLEVAEGDALSYLSSLEDASLGGIFAAQVVEHLEPAYLARMLETAWHKMRPGGIIALETINPACWVAFFESYIRDLTHVRPLHPETLQYLVRVSGFQNVEIEFKSPIPESDRLQPVLVPPSEQQPGVVALAEGFNEAIAKLNARMFTFQDYAVIGRK